jgi:hypothetical protein
MSSHSFKEAMKKTAMCWDDLRPGDIVSTMVSDKVKRLYLVVENARRGHYIRMVSLEDGDPTDLPKEDFACRLLRESKARLYHRPE